MLSSFIGRRWPRLVEDGGFLTSSPPQYCGGAPLKRGNLVPPLWGGGPRSGGRGKNF